MKHKDRLLVRPYEVGAYVYINMGLLFDNMQGYKAKCTNMIICFCTYIYIYTLYIRIYLIYPSQQASDYVLFIGFCASNRKWP